MLKLSQSGLNTFQRCSARYYFRYVTRPRLPIRTDYARLCGNVVHNMVASFHKKGNSRNKFFYTNKNKALGAWWHFWRVAVKENEPKLMEISAEKADMFYKKGAKCISQYWNIAYNLPHPLYAEERLSAYVRDVELVGVFDQIREVPIEKIAKKRPELVVNGKLLDGYNPHVIMDLKTGWNPYNTKRMGPDPTEEQIERKQMTLHGNLQATVYTYIYQQHFKALPVWSVFFFLSDDEEPFYPTNRSEEDYLSMFSTIIQVRDNIDAGTFSQNFDSGGCSWCDYWEYCRGPKDRVISLPGVSFGSEIQVARSTTQVEFVEPKQMPLKMKFQRKSRKKKTKGKTSVIETATGPIKMETPPFMRDDDE